MIVITNLSAWSLDGLSLVFSFNSSNQDQKTLDNLDSNNFKYSN